MGHKPNTCMIVCKRHCANEGFFLFVDFVSIGIKCVVTMSIGQLMEMPAENLFWATKQDGRLIE